MPQYYQRTMSSREKNKYTKTRFHFIYELVMNGEMDLQFCKSQDQLENIFTKPLAQDNFQFLKK